MKIDVSNLVKEHPYIFLTTTFFLTSIVLTILENIVFKLIYSFSPSAITQSYFLLPCGLQFILQIILLSAAMIFFKKLKLLLVLYCLIFIIIGPVISFYTTFAIWYILGLPVVDLL